MKDTNKVTLTVEQLKKLINEASKEEDFSNIVHTGTSEAEAREKQDVEDQLDKIESNLNYLINNTLYSSKKFRDCLRNAIGDIWVAKLNYR